ncbi:hypothetical protein [Permianibacter aggregans]|uniref:Uncharacterized protein n=1 Tax=Permianibacter aggregans TaxID=1510150 RepID=A0A4R6USX7_9GAMM|nr:hypothetical protein [Permianibacter aggregans]QGX40492.1 hypothetical protein E2H98_12755 [Permianibacter aggregans]TDQ49366.1 hypothetical protein EV696_10470 [Permianibacter aggregans]
MADLWDFIQHFQIDRARENAIDAKYTALSASSQIEQLEQRVEALALTCQAMWELLSRQQDFSNQLLMEKMEEIDLRDGVRDGKSTATSQHCQQCRHKLSDRHPYCFYCGAALPKGQAFQRKAR